MTTQRIREAVCPECGKLLHPVGLKTVKHLLKFEIARTLREGHYQHCPDPACDIIYVRSDATEDDSAGDVFRRRDIKDCAMPDATGQDRLVCYCFGYTAGEIQDDAASGAHLVPAAIAAEVKAGNCACEVKNPAGH